MDNPWISECASPRNGPPQAPKKPSRSAVKRLRGDDDRPGHMSDVQMNPVLFPVFNEAENLPVLIVCWTCYGGFKRNLKS